MSSYKMWVKDAIRRRVGRSDGYGRIYLPQDWIGREVVVIGEEDFSTLLKEHLNLKVVRSILAHVLNSGSEGRRMFSIVTKTWNPVTGCMHNCSYCWARRLATTKLREKERYREGFIPKLNPKEFRARFRDGDVVFVSDMGDLFGDFIPSEWVRKVIEHVSKFPQAYFLFMTKNPERYAEFLDAMPENAILGATIETNRDEDYLSSGISRAPLPSRRYEAMVKLDWDKKFVAIEPILDFDLRVMLGWMREIHPVMTYVGYDNYGNRLPEPPLQKTLDLIDALSEFTLVVKKTIRRAWFEGVEGYFNDGNRGKGKRNRGRKGRQEDFEWLYEKVKDFRSLTDEVAGIMPEVHYEAHSWSVLKLIALSYWVGVYTKIIPKHFTDYWYIDLLSGPGTMKVQETGDVFLGSPFISFVYAREPFKKYVFVEMNQERFLALRQRAKKVIGMEASVYKEDCNRLVRKLEVKAQHSLIFIDLEGTEVWWSTMEALLNLKSDIILLFQTALLNRTLGRARSEKVEDREPLDRFFGDSSWEEARDGSELLKLYMDKLSRHRSYVQNIKIRGKTARGGFYYDVILACRKDGYVSAWESLKERLERSTSRWVEVALSMLKGERKGLDEFMAMGLEGWIAEGR